MNDAAARPMPTQQQAQPAPPCTLVIFGAGGDLTKRLLVPSLCNLLEANLLSPHFTLIGVARTKLDKNSFGKMLEEAVHEFGPDDKAAKAWSKLADRIDYISGNFDDPGTYERLGKRLDEAAKKEGTEGNCLFYLATPPNAFITVAQGVHKAGLLKEDGKSWRRLVIEKPFGSDLPTAQALNRDLLALMDEKQIYRIDHYLGKETVQNIMILRFANGFFEPMWNRDHIDHIQITVAETVGVEHRGEFYEKTGTLRDMVPNHLFQLLSLAAMEPPNCFDADAVRSEKAKVLGAVHRLDREAALANVVRGQYGPGSVGDKKLVAYRDEPEVAKDSTTETYVALRLMIDNWRWAGVPFYLRTGKALAARRSEIAIRFKQAPFALFRDTPVERLTPNDMILRIQPEEGVTLRFGAKVPGPVMTMSDVAMRFNYADYFKVAPSTGYETLLYDCMIGDATLFQRADNIESGWAIVQPILDAWAAAPAKSLPVYTAGSQGPREADALLAREGRQWRRIE
jgi:glucose-6-phosphate 1-dehydrogenase